MVGGGAAVAVMIIFWAAIWNPLFKGTAALDEQVNDTENLLARVYRAEALRRPNNRPRNTGKGSLVVIVDQTTRSAGLSEALKRNQPDGPDGIRVTLQGANFDSLVRWLSVLDSNHGVIVDTVSVDQTRQAGLVNCTLVLRRS